MVGSGGGVSIIVCCVYVHVCYAASGSETTTRKLSFSKYKIFDSYFQNSNWINSVFRKLNSQTIFFRLLNFETLKAKLSVIDGKGPGP